jgi:glycosyltransferase involved in cell wall biosynthesis
MRRALREANPHLVAIPGWANRAGLVALEWSLRNSIPVIVMSESTLIDAERYWLKEAVKKRILSLAGAALTGGERSARYMTMLGMPPDRVFVGYDVVDNAYFAGGAQQARSSAELTRETLHLPDRYFLASARFIPKKNLSGLLRAYARYRALQGEKAWKLVILGHGPLQESLVRQRHELGLDGEVSLPGFVQYDLLPAYYGLARAFVHASLVEQWGLVVNEALAAGLPVLVSNRCGCVPELVSEGRNGFVFEPLDIDGLAQLMVRMSGQDLRAMGQASEQIVAEWSPDRFAEGMLSAARAALSKGAPRPPFLGSLLLKAVALS